MIVCFFPLDIGSLDVELIESVGELTCALEELLTTSDPTSLTEEGACLHECIYS